MGPPPIEIFFQPGSGNRVSGVGNVSMVSGALSQRKLTACNANRGWVSLTIPEPSGALGVLTALGVLGLCRAVARQVMR